MSVLFARMSTYYIHAWCLWRQEENIRSPGAGVTDHGELPYGWWELNPGPLKD